MQAEPVWEGELRELAARGQFDVFARRNECPASKKAEKTRWVWTWKIVDGEKCVEARLLAEGFQDTDVQEGLVDTPGCVSLRSSHVRVFSISAIKKWGIRSLGITLAFL